jgi:hypothetical protein
LLQVRQSEERSNTRGTKRHISGRVIDFLLLTTSVVASLLPHRSFGEEKTYWTLNWFEKARMNLLAARNIPPVWFLGKYGILPFDNIDITLVVGEAIQLPKIEKPTKEDVDKYHALYVAGLRKVFDENKKDYATEDAILELQ